MRSRFGYGMFLIALILTAAVVSPGMLSGQTLGDTVSIYRAVLQHAIPEEGLTGPEGNVQIVCRVISSEGFSLAMDAEDESLSDTLPDLTPRLEQLILRVLEEEYHLPLVEGCAGWLDEAERQGVDVQFSAPRFESQNAVEIYSGMTMGGLWGSGSRCKWVRNGRKAPWRPDGCSSAWISE